MSSSEKCDRAAKALLDIQDTANLIVLDLLEGGEVDCAATRFAAIREYATEARECLIGLPQGTRVQLPAGRVNELRFRS